ncbi:YeiH family protein [Streptomyces sp. TR06-5]|uniref:YeiH family protein n=1 Tax=unclassified Streptomyces TaxID=2593676 RepID=UPI0039A1CF02
MPGPGPRAAASPLTDRAAPAASAAPAARRRGRRGPLPGLALAAGGVLLAEGVHTLLPAVPALTTALVLGVAAAHLPRVRDLVAGAARPGLVLAGKRLMRLGIVLLGLRLGLDDVLGLGWSSALMVAAVVAATFGGTLWLGRRLGLPGDQPLLIATGYAICGASAVGAVSQVRRSDERDVAASVTLVTLCGTLAIGVLPLLQGPLGLDTVQFGRWVGAGVHDVGQVVATAQTAGPAALGEAVLVKLLRVALLAPLVAAVAVSTARRLRQRTGARPASPDAAESDDGARPPLVPLFVLGFLAMVLVRTTGAVPDAVLQGADTAKELLLAAALFGLGSAVHLPSLARTGARAAVLGLGAWVVVAGASYGGVLLTTA